MLTDVVDINDINVRLLSPGKSLAAPMSARMVYF